MFGKGKDQKDGGQQRAAKDESKRHLVFTKNELGNSQGVGRETGKFWLQHHIAQMKSNLLKICEVTFK